MIMNGKTPTLISGVPNVAPSRATIRSQASARPSAPASTWPLAAQIDGLPSWPMQREQRAGSGRCRVLVDERHVGGEAGEVAAGREDLLVRRGEHDAAHVVVGLGRARARRAGRRAARRTARCASRAGPARSSRRPRRRRSDGPGHGARMVTDGADRARCERRSRKSYCSLSRPFRLPSSHGLLRLPCRRRGRARRRPQARLRAPAASTSSSPTSTTSCASRSARFVTKELAPARRGVGGDDVPRLGLPPHGRARVPRPRQARGVRRPGRRLLLGARPRPRRSSTARSGGLAMGVAVHTDMAHAADPRLRHRGAEAGVGRARDRRARRSSASGSPSPTRAPTSPASRPAPCATATSTSSTARRPTSPTATAPT